MTQINGPKFLLSHGGSFALTRPIGLKTNSILHTFLLLSGYRNTEMSNTSDWARVVRGLELHAQWSVCSSRGGREDGAPTGRPRRRKRQGGGHRHKDSI